MASTYTTQTPDGRFLTIVSNESVTTIGIGETESNAELDAETLLSILTNPDLLTLWVKGLQAAKYETGEI